MSAFDELGGKPETYEQALARSEACLNPKHSEQETAEQIVAKRESYRQHQAYFAHDYLTISEQVVISRQLAKMLGYSTEADGYDQPD